MLRYLGFGHRQFGLYPLVSKPRINWEFYAVVRGRCAPVFGNRAKLPFATKTLWIFPPGSSHGWAGVGNRRCFIAAFHFGSVPPQLDAAVTACGYLELPLSADECKRIEELAGRLQPDFKRRTNLSGLLFQGALTELSLLALCKLPQQTVVLPENQAERTVEAASLWFSERAHLNPSIAAVASQLHVSVSTLRRRFYVARQASPAHVFEKIRIGLAMQLMSGTDYKLDFIATRSAATRARAISAGPSSHSRKSLRTSGGARSSARRTPLCGSAGESFWRRRPGWDCPCFRPSILGIWRDCRALSRATAPSAWRCPPEARPNIAPDWPDSSKAPSLVSSRWNGRRKRQISGGAISLFFRDGSGPFPRNHPRRDPNRRG